MKVFIGCNDIASVLSGIAEGFSQTGHQVTSFVLERNKFYPDAEYDLIKEPPIHSIYRYNEKKIPAFVKSGFQIADRFFRKSDLRRHTTKFIDEFDLFVFIWQPWLDEAELFPLIKNKGKKIICLHLGSDVRHIDAYKQEFNEDVSLWENYFHEEDLNEKIRKIRFHELYADAIFSVPDQAGLAVRGYNHLHLPLRNLEKIEFNIPDRRKPVILHAPSRSGIKGTGIILDALDKLNSEGFKFELKLLQNLSNIELISELSDADILIDEIFLHGPGVLSIEAMAAGTLVATRTIGKYKDIFNPPVVDIRPHNVYDKVKDILNSRSRYTEYIHKGQEYVRRNNTPANIAEGLIKSLGDIVTDYDPHFFQNEFRMPKNKILNPEVLKLNSSVIHKFRSGQADVNSLQNRGLI